MITKDDHRSVYGTLRKLLSQWTLNYLFNDRFTSPRSYVDDASHCDRIELDYIHLTGHRIGYIIDVDQLVVVDIEPTENINSVASCGRVLHCSNKWKEICTFSFLIHSFILFFVFLSFTPFSYHFCFVFQNCSKNKMD